MDSLTIKATEFTPGINFQSDGNLNIFGVSRPEDVIKFYIVPISWLKNFIKYIFSKADNNLDTPNVNLTFKMRYFNSASSKSILQILDLICQINNKGIAVNINWYYDEADEQMLEDGEDLSDAVDLPFNFIVE